jgi:hypothetical protein
MEYPKLQRARLELTINVLEDVIAYNKNFNMNDWLFNSVVNRNSSVSDINLNSFGEECFVCGTSACAFGYAALDPRLQAFGLYMELEDEHFGECVKVNTTEEFNDNMRKMIQRIAMDDPNASMAHIVARPKFKEFVDFDAASEFYGISNKVADYLFYPYAYENRHEGITPQQVIDRIRKVLNNDGII